MLRESVQDLGRISYRVLSVEMLRTRWRGMGVRGLETAQCARVDRETLSPTLVASFSSSSPMPKSSRPPLCFYLLERVKIPTWKMRSKHERVVEDVQEAFYHANYSKSRTFPEMHYPVFLSILEILRL